MTASPKKEGKQMTKDSHGVLSSLPEDDGDDSNYGLPKFVETGDMQ